MTDWPGVHAVIHDDFFLINEPGIEAGQLLTIWGHGMT